MSLTASGSAAVALTSAALMGLSAIAMPGLAGADEVNCDPADTTYSVTGGTIEWGVKQSFRSYLQGPIAHGGWTLTEGVTFTGAERGADGRFVWPIAQDGGTVRGAAAATASGAGSVTLYGHDDVLNTTLSNPTVTIDGTEGSLEIDYRAKKAESFTAGSPFEWVEGEQATAVRFSLESAPAFHSDGTTTIVTGATDSDLEFDDALGGMYGAGSEMDSVTLNLIVAATCEDAPGDGGNPGDDNTPGDGNPNEGETPGDSNNGGGIFGSLGSIFGSLGA